MPALHRRNVPICRPFVDGGMRKCSAGACPPLGSGWGVAESAAPIRCTKPQLRLFIPWRAGSSRQQRLLRKQTPNSSLRRSKACPVPRYGAGVQGWGNPLAPQPVSSHRHIGTPFRHSGPPFVIPAPAGIHAPSLRLRTSIAIPPTTTTRIPQNPASQSAIPATSYPYPIRRPTPQRAAAPMTPGYLHLGGTVHPGLIVKLGTCCAGGRPQPTARRQPRHRICSLSPWERVRVRVNKSPLRIRRPNKNRRHCRGDSRIAHRRVAAYPGHPPSTRTEPHKQWYSQTYVRLPHATGP